MDLNDYIKQQQERLKALESERAQLLAEEGRIAEASAQANAQTQSPTKDTAELPTPSGPEMLRSDSRTVEGIDSDIKDVKNNIAAAQYTLNSPFADKVQDMAKEKFDSFMNGTGAALEAVNTAGKFVLNSREAVGRLIGEAANAFAQHHGHDLGEIGNAAQEMYKIVAEQLPKVWDKVAYDISVAVDKGIEQVKELGTRTAELATQGVEQAKELGAQAADIATNSLDNAVVQAKVLGSQTLDMAAKMLEEAKVVPSAEQMKQIAALDEKQTKERNDREEVYAKARENIEKNFANDPKKGEYEKTVNDSVDKMRQELQAKQEQEIRRELHLTLLTIPLSPTL
jgi:hypothetical protein